ncbi:hypothetical protein CDO73_11705 [Saccharibacillus sp. O23]|uniref:putative immunity/bacteriocin fusion bifunctional protein n=1 Tax=Saccharibacillus sp. O23 TaxID=2009338 RepID=UPI000B4E2C45|nr:putative immunity/bacteriocin fusion bifunctional protein [Saccharibacillus sp. O23]OWR30565.1 hypothetical protein CDO73_11705 [Saccharibacillus sp. O23]
MKKNFIFSLILVLIFTVLGHTSTVKAESTILDKQQQLTNEKNQPINIDVLTSEELIKVVGLENENQEIQNINQQIHQQKFEEIQLSNHNSKLKYSLKGDAAIYTYMVTRAYNNIEKNEIIVTQTIVNGTDNKIEKFVAEKTNASDPDSKHLLANYQNTDTQNQQKDSLSAKAAGGMFLWNGKSFTCSVVGLYACAQYCGVWALVNPIAGGGCSVVCGVAFAAACSF